MTDAKVQRELSIRSESVQRVFNFHTNDLFYVNRRYQRKLIWTEDEKRQFIDSIVQGYPVPIVLLAEAEIEGKRAFEIIDGMQRLNAITAFIEGEFSFDGCFFDLNTMVESKSLLDNGQLNQKEPVLARAICESIASYILPLSVYSFDDARKVDDIFRRINAGGKHLSRQELRAAGSLRTFADIVRELSAEIRTDVSQSTILPLHMMREISITDSTLPYGIPVSSLFWVNNSIITKEMIRESRDEEIVSDIVASIVLDEYPGSSSIILDEYYGLRESEKTGAIDNAMQKRQIDRIRFEFLQVYDEIRTIIENSSKSFQQLIFRDPAQRLPRYFEVLFLAVHNLMFIENKRVADYSGLIKTLEGIAQHITITAGGNWSAKNKTDNVNAVKGIISPYFQPAAIDDPGSQKWVTEFETILMQSRTEQNLYDFKQGFLSLDGNNLLNEGLIKKIVKTLTAMVNKSAVSVGYVCVGIPDKVDDMSRIKALFSITPFVFRNFTITGVGHEPPILGLSTDEYFKKIIDSIKSEPIQDEYKDIICKNVRLIKYYDKDILLLKIISVGTPAIYDGKYYTRHGSHLQEIPPESYPQFFVAYQKSGEQKH
ncbi:DUF262 domain-containing protein [Desulfobacter sp.]|uniref:DUF262 domain-containing protein n=1 Tax=Desulfobacter sp. TaxID=2294 RepID=UPI000E803B07|nr:DUF262 domain-containing protein [Desulfobacter sp.]HBT87897.1 AAA family ATPase [Desulfobacter sp.]